MSITDGLTKVATVDTNINSNNLDAAGANEASDAPPSSEATAPTAAQTDEVVADSTAEPKPDVTQAGTNTQPVVEAHAVSEASEQSSDKSSNSKSKSKTDKSKASPAAKAKQQSPASSAKSAASNKQNKTSSKTGRSSTDTSVDPSSSTAAGTSESSNSQPRAEATTTATTTPASKPPEGDVCENWEELDQEQIDKSLKAVKITATTEEDEGSVKKINNTKMPVTQMLSLGNEPQKQVRILKRQQPEKKPLESSTSANPTAPVSAPIKTFEQREAEYARARLRILGSAHPPEEPPSSSAPTEPTLTHQISSSSSNGSTNGGGGGAKVASNSNYGNISQGGQPLMNQHQLSLSQTQLTNHLQYQAQQYHQTPLQHVPSAPSQLFSFNPSNSNQNQYSSNQAKYNNSNLNSKGNQYNNNNQQMPNNAMMYPDLTYNSSNMFNQKVVPPYNSNVVGNQNSNMNAMSGMNTGQQLNNNALFLMNNNQKGQMMGNNNNNAGGGGNNSFNPNHQMKNFSNLNANNMNFNTNAGGLGANLGYNFPNNIPKMLNANMGGGGGGNGVVNNSPGIIGCPPGSNFANYPNNNNNNPSQINVIRDPINPDGTRGFRRNYQPNNNSNNNFNINAGGNKNNGANNAFYLNSNAAASNRDYKAN